MIPYHVTFRMPSWIADGIGKGVYEVVGGVVRQVDGKQVVMWLRPGLANAAKSGAPLLRPLGTLGGGMALSLAATAGVGLLAVAGFVMLKQQHDQTVERLDAMLDCQRRTEDGVDQLLVDTYDRAKHAVHTALETIAMEEERAAFDALQQPIVTLRENGKFLVSRMEGILARKPPMPRSPHLVSAPLFVELAALFALVTQAKARALTLYQGVQAAEREAMADQAIYVELRQRFLAPLRHPNVHLEDFVRLTEEQDAAMRECMPHLPRPEALEFVRVPGLTRDPAMLRALLDVMVAEADAQTAGIIPAEAAPEGWTPDMETVAANVAEAQR